MILNAERLVDLRVVDVSFFTLICESTLKPPDESF